MIVCPEILARAI